ncbi:MAG: effector binding domain-containing protein [Thermonemataceae bacterium]
MAEDKPRIARLSAILTQLQSRQLVTARALAEKFQVSIRTIYRDIRTLEQSGVPIVTEEGKGYSLIEGYRLPPVSFTDEEATALIIAEQLIQKNSDQSLTDSYESAITKIKAVLKRSQKAQTEFLVDRLQVRGKQKKNKTSHYLIQLQATINTFQVVKISYLSLEKQYSERLIEPFALYTSKENWVLVAHCRKRADFRAFRLDCIQDLTMTNAYFTPHPFTLQEYFEQCRKKYFSTPDIPLSQTATTLTANQPDTLMQPTTVQPFKLIGLSVRTINEVGRADKEIAQLWERFMAENMLEKIPNKVDNTIYSLYTDYEGDHTQPYTVLLGCKVTDLTTIPAGMIGKSFEGGTYVKTTAKGDLTKGIVINKWIEIWAMDLDRAYTADFEVYSEKARNPQEAEVDFLIAVK